MLEYPRMAVPTLVFEVMSSLPQLGAVPGDFIVCEPGALESEADVLLVRGIPRGRLGQVLGANLDEVIRLCDPPACDLHPSELLAQLLQPASPA